MAQTLQLASLLVKAPYKVPSLNTPDVQSGFQVPNALSQPPPYAIQKLPTRNLEFCSDLAGTIDMKKALQSGRASAALSNQRAGGTIYASFRGLLAL